MNSLMEWLLIPAALFCNWHIPKRRTFIVIAAVAFYAMRVWSYVYFVPNIFEFGALSGRSVLGGGRGAVSNIGESQLAKICNSGCLDIPAVHPSCIRSRFCNWHLPANCPMSVSPSLPSSGGAPPPISRSCASADLMVPTTSG